MLPAANGNGAASPAKGQGLVRGWPLPGKAERGWSHGKEHASEARYTPTS